MFMRLVESAFPLRAGEHRLTLALFLHSLFAVGAFLTGRTVRDTLFLAHYDRGALAWMYVASALAVTAVGLLYGPLAARLRRDKLALGTALLFSLVFGTLWWLERGEPRWVYPILYVYVEVAGALSLVQFWTLANELFNPREAKRLYGLIGSGGTIANILIGLAGAAIATHLGARALILLCAALSVGMAAASFTAGRLGRQRIFARAAAGRMPAPTRSVRGAARVLHSPHLRAVALLAALTFVTTTLVDFEFKVIASGTYSKDELAAYFGYFNVVVGVLALALQLFGTSRLLHHAGVIGALAVLPLSLALGNLAVAFFPLLWAASLAKGADTLFRYSVNDATTQILYLPVASKARAAAKAFVDGVVKPVAIGVAGLALVGYKTWIGAEPRWLALFALLLCGAWGLTVVGLRSKYIRSLHDNLRHRRLDLAGARHKVMDGSTSSVLVKALASDDPREVLGALELVPYLEQIELDHRVEALLDHSVPEVRVATLSYYARRQSMRFANSVFRRFEDKEAVVRAAAIDAFCAIGQDKAVRSVRPFLADADPAIRAAAVTGMIRYGGLDGVLMAAEALKALIFHPEAVMRKHAAKVLGAIGVRNFYQPVLTLMNDPDPAVRREAIIAAAALRSPEFVLPLIYKTQSTETLHEAVNALSQYGPQVIPTLAKVLDNSLEGPPIRRAVGRVLGRMATAEAVQQITRHLNEPDEELRAGLYKSLARAVKGRRTVVPNLRVVRAALDQELARAYRAISQAEVLRLGSGVSHETPRQGVVAAEALLASALADKVANAERRIFLLLAVLYPDADMEHIYAGLRDASLDDAVRRRANAVELLDNLLDRDLKRVFLPLLEEFPRSERLRQVEGLIALPRATREETIRALCQDETAWVRACGQWYACKALGPLSADLLEEGAGDLSPVVREVCLQSLEETAPDRARRVAQAHLMDEASVVRQRAALISSRRSATA